MPAAERSPVIEGVVLVHLQAHIDGRGRFVETYRREWFPDGDEMVQGNRSDKRAGTLLGLHFHRHQADYWYVLRGKARIVLHDLRIGSPTERATLAFDVDEDDGPGIYIPRGVAHGFAALTDLTMTYLVDRYYDPGDELGVTWDDPEIGVDWGVAQPILSERDRTNPPRSEAELPDWK